MPAVLAGDAEMVRGAFRLGATILVLFLCCAPFAPARAGCDIDDVGDAFSSAVDSMQDLLSSPACMPLLASPAFWIVSGAFTAATTSSNQMRGLCDDLQSFNKDSLDAQQQANDLFNKLPAEIRNSLADAFGGLSQIASDLNPVIGYASCACSVANSTGAARLVDVAGVCTKDAICGIQEFFGGPSCESNEHFFELFDCTKGAPGGSGGFFDTGNGFYTDYQGAFGCFCPKPMRLYPFYGLDGSRLENCPGSDSCQVCSCPAPSKFVALGVCICPNGSPLQADGTCAPPCPGSCPAGQIVKSAFRQANGECVSQCICPPGQSMQDGVCQFPPCAIGQTRIPSGACCAYTQVSACGECCRAGQIPDADTGTCVGDWHEKKDPNRLPKPATILSPAALSPGGP